MEDFYGEQWDICAVHGNLFRLGCSQCRKKLTEEEARLKREEFDRILEMFFVEGGEND